MKKNTFGVLDYPFGLDFSNDVFQTKIQFAVNKRNLSSRR